MAHLTGQTDSKINMFQLNLLHFEFELHMMLQSYEQMNLVFSKLERIPGVPSSTYERLADLTLKSKLPPQQACIVIQNTLDALLRETQDSNNTTTKLGDGRGNLDYVKFAQWFRFLVMAALLNPQQSVAWGYFEQILDLLKDCQVMNTMHKLIYSI